MPRTHKQRSAQTHTVQRAGMHTRTHTCRCGNEGTSLQTAALPAKRRASSEAAITESPSFQSFPLRSAGEHAASSSSLSPRGCIALAAAEDGDEGALLEGRSNDGCETPTAGEGRGRRTKSCSHQFTEVEINMTAARLLQRLYFWVAGRRGTSLE